MSNKKTETAPKFSTPEPNYTREALSIYQDKVTKTWNLVKIDYDPDTKAVSPVEVLLTHEDWYEVMGAFENRIDSKVLNDSN